MNISKITESLKGHDQRFPPVEKWNPELCDGHEFLIDREGNWFYDGSAIKNIKLMKQNKHFLLLSIIFKT